MNASLNTKISQIDFIMYIDFLLKTVGFRLIFNCKIF